MERPVARADAALVRKVIARAMLDRAEGAASVGSVSLRAHQRSAVARLRVVMRELGGALLADDAGLGKTYVAATLAREAARPLIVAPASLGTMWSEALRATGVRADVVTYTALSRGTVPRGEFDLLVLDEAHHARTPATRRYARLAELSRSAQVLLLSATPIHNTPRDLRALCALFLGARAWTMDDAALARCIVRRERSDVADTTPLPDAATPRWVEIGSDDALLRDVLALPPPLPPSDGGDGGALLAWSLVRQWASSQGALAAALRRRIARAAALAAALQSGRHPSKAELAAWAFAGDAMQLAFPELVASPARARATDLLAAVCAHEHAVHALLEKMRHAPDLDAARATRLAALRAAHPGEKIVAFTQYAETVRALYEHLRHAPGVAALTAAGARVAGGSLSRREAIAHFAPAASHVRPPPDAERIDLLLATDVLSEGLNLQDASVVVHLDLPWTPARLEQRVGRSRRIGARHARTSVYAFAPPAATESLLRVEDRLREKMRIAGRAVGIAGTILPPIAGAVTHEEPSAARTVELLHQALARWGDACDRGPERAHRGDGAVLVAAVRAEHHGFLALLHDRGAPLLLAALDGHRATEAASTLLDASRAAGGADVPPDDRALLDALAMLDGWSVRHEGARAAGGAVPIRARSRHQAMRRIAAITARMPHHRRASLAPLVAQARRAATARYGIGAERVLGELVHAELGDEPWLRALAAFGTMHATSSDAADPGRCAEPVAILLLQGDENG